MSLATLIQTHGYMIIFLGTFFEGETILVLGGIAAHRGYLALGGVMLAAFCGSLLCDQIFFYLGRRHGEAILKRRPTWRKGAKRIDELFIRYDAILIIGFRFLYGLRTLTPFVIGMSASVSVGRFALLNAVGATIWAIVVAAAGYMVGDAMEAILGRARHYEIVAFSVVALCGALLWIRNLRRSRRERLASTDADPITG